MFEKKNLKNEIKQESDVTIHVAWLPPSGPDMWCIGKGQKFTQDLLFCR